MAQRVKNLMSLLLDSGYCCGSDLVPGLGTSACRGHGQKKTKNQKTKTKNKKTKPQIKSKQLISSITTFWVPSLPSYRQRYIFPVLLSHKTTVMAVIIGLDFCLSFLFEVIEGIYLVIFISPAGNTRHSYLGRLQ